MATNAGTPWLRIERSVRQGFAVFTLSGHMKAEEVAELQARFDADYRTIILDLGDVRLADRDAVKFLRDCEADGMKLENCPAYVREWMDREEDFERTD
jgi:predicted metal-binding protein